MPFENFQINISDQSVYSPPSDPCCISPFHDSIFLFLVLFYSPNSVDSINVMISIISHELTPLLTPHSPGTFPAPIFSRYYFKRFFNLLSRIFWLCSYHFQVSPRTRRRYTHPSAGTHFPTHPSMLSNHLLLFTYFIHYSIDESVDSIALSLLLPPLSPTSNCTPQIKLPQTPTNSLQIFHQIYFTFFSLSWILLCGSRLKIQVCVSKHAKASFTSSHLKSPKPMLA